MHGAFLHSNAFETRSYAPRTFRPGRQRARSRLEKEIESPTVREIKEEEMDTDSVTGAETQQPPLPLPVEDLIDRVTRCLPPIDNEATLPGGDEGFQDVLRHHLPSAESTASERLVSLKAKLRTASTYDFWALLMEEICDIAGSQCGFVAKRMLGDHEDRAVAVPELGSSGSCLMGVAIYINNGAEVKKLYRDHRYCAYGTPCAHMPHDKVLIVPERLAEVTPHNPNAVPWGESEAFIGVPLSTEGRGSAHFGMVWSPEGASQRTLSWSFIQMLMHSLEDMVSQRLLEGRGVQEVPLPESSSAAVISPAAITASQSLKPYARSLSHELRTPMQGVVGMLDIMYTTVLDAIPHQQPSEHVRSVLEDLKSCIEVVQESSRRAVEAADNVVHAYDLNMQMPETSLTAMDSPPSEIMTRPGSALSHGRWPSVELMTSLIGTKRERSESFSFRAGRPGKRTWTAEAETTRSYCCSEECNVVSLAPVLSPAVCPMMDECLGKERLGYRHMSPAVLSSTHRRVVTRKFLRGLVEEALRHSHSTSEIREHTEQGEQIRVMSRGSRGELLDRTIYLEISPGVPEVMFTEEQHLQFALQKLVDNAIKFTEHGTIRICVKLSRSLAEVEIWVIDTGCGISEGSRCNLFQPHFQEDASIRRARDGLGLSLFNAKAHVRKNLGGDVTLERSCTHGPAKGSEFLVRLPISALVGAESGRPDADADADADVDVLVATLPTPPPTTAFDSPRLRPSPLPEPESRQGSHPRSPDSAQLPNAIPIPNPSPNFNTSLRKRVVFNPELAIECPLNILIAEDNAINRNVAIGSLKKLGYHHQNITLAFDGREAVEQYKASLAKSPPERFALILMDIWMPNLDGYGATTQILELAKAHGDPTTIVAVTADITEDAVDRGKAAGMHGFLAKPYTVLDIEHLIVEHFRRCY
ncbi:HHK17, histidine kinase-group VII protein [Diplocarpon rosae]|nr:HHK17, histidine kinase-group VII protein [Diplocarpon rosae]